MSRYAQSYRVMLRFATSYPRTTPVAPSSRKHFDTPEKLPKIKTGRLATAFIGAGFLAASFSIHAAGASLVLCIVFQGCRVVLLAQALHVHVVVKEAGFEEGDDSDAKAERIECVAGKDDGGGGVGMISERVMYGGVGGEWRGRGREEDGEEWVHGGALGKGMMREWNGEES